MFHLPFIIASFEIEVKELQGSLSTCGKVFSERMGEIAAPIKRSIT
jgi:hypothetical protein